MRFAAIDCGTNTALMLVAERTADESSPGAPRLRLVRDFLEMPRLGQDLDRTGRLREDAMERTLAALVRQKERAAELGVARLLAVATESVRAAANGAEFLARAEAAGVPLRVLSGDDEARLSFLSIAAAFPTAGAGPASHRSVLDIGGGSTELIVGEGAQPREWKSVPIGSVRLTERLIKSDPPTPAEQAALTATIDEAVARLPQPQGELYALAGTATTVATLHLGLAEYASDKVDGLRIAVADIASLVARLASLSVAERKQLPGLDARRADVIYAGAAILLQVARRAGVREVIISDRGVRWGVLEELSAATAAA